MRYLVCVSVSFLFACDGPVRLEPTATRDEPAPGDPGPLDLEAPVAPIEVPPEASRDHPHDDPPFLMSRYGPTQGVAGTRVTLLTAFETAGCGTAGTCSVAIGGVPAPIVEDAFTLDVVVPDGAVTGPLCVTWQSRSECGAVFTVLRAPVLYWISPERAAAGSAPFTLEFHGDGFMANSEVRLDWSALPTTFLSPQLVTVTMPAGALEAPGTHTVFVYSPSLGRCGAGSEPLDFTVQ